MSKDKRVFIDGVGETRMQDGAIRLDLLAMSPTSRNEDGSPTSEFVQQLVMTPVGFVRMVNTMRNTLRAMGDKGYFDAESSAIGTGPEQEAADMPSAPSPVAEEKVSDAGPRRRVAGSPNF